MDVVLKYRGWILGVILILNILTCLIYRYASEPSVVGMGLMLYLLPLLCIQILTIIVGCFFINNQIVSYISLILSILVLAISVYSALSIK
jgi:hypothetical protein